MRQAQSGWRLPPAGNGGQAAAVRPWRPSWRRSPPPGASRIWRVAGRLDAAWTDLLRSCCGTPTWRHRETGVRSTGAQINGVAESAGVALESRSADACLAVGDPASGDVAVHMCRPGRRRERVRRPRVSLTLTKRVTSPTRIRRRSLVVQGGSVMGVSRRWWTVRTIKERSGGQRRRRSRHSWNALVSSISPREVRRVMWSSM